MVKIRALRTAIWLMRVINFEVSESVQQIKGPESWLGCRVGDAGSRPHREPVQTTGDYVAAQ